MKTAVEWLQEQLECFGNKHELQMSWTTLDELLKQAKEIEKRQIIDAYNTFGDYLKAEEYYNKTFK